jgi:hypothetical protein
MGVDISCHDENKRGGRLEVELHGSSVAVIDRQKVDYNSNTGVEDWQDYVPSHLVSLVKVCECWGRNIHRTAQFDERNFPRRSGLPCSRTSLLINDRSRPAASGTLRYPFKSHSIHRTQPSCGPT